MVGSRRSRERDAESRSSRTVGAGSAAGHEGRQGRPHGCRTKEGSGGQQICIGLGLNKPGLVGCKGVDSATQTPIPELAGVLSPACLHCRPPTTALPTATIRGCAPPLASTGATLASGPRGAPALVPPRHWSLVCAFSVVEREPGGGPTRGELVEKGKDEGSMIFFSGAAGEASREASSQWDGSACP